MSKSTKTYHHILDAGMSKGHRYLWTCQDSIAFDDLLISWKARRPSPGGEYLISVRIYRDGWSIWLPYAAWKEDSQGSFEAKTKCGITHYQDTIHVDAPAATGFQIEVEAKGSASLDNFYALHVSVSKTTELDFRIMTGNLSMINLDVPRLSQMLINHPRHKHLCSPTSTTAVIRYLQKNSEADPLDFALNSYDHNFDIFGNWALNTSQASSMLKNDYHCWVQRLNGFEELHGYLLRGFPVVVSIKGDLTGAPQPYMQGHLVVVRGYDSTNRRVLCMDPAFPDLDDVYVAYALEEFLEAWHRRNYVAYLYAEVSTAAFQ